MKCLNQKEFASYSENCFCINIDDASINENNYSHNPTFVHEYIHYLQTISLPCMQIKYSHFAETLAIMANQITNNDIFKRPFSEAINNIQKTNKELFKHYFNEEQVFTDIAKIKKLKKKVVKIDSFFLHTYYLVFSDSEGNELTYEITARDLAENMAFIIEKELFNSPYLCDVPYGIINKIIDYKYSKLKLTNLQVAKLIELSMYSLEPIAVLFSNLDKMMKQKTPINEKDYFNFFYKGIKITSPDKKMRCNSINESLENSTAKIIYNIMNIFSAPYIQESLFFITSIFKASAYRYENPTFISDMIEKGIDKLDDAYNTFGLPLIKFQNDTIISPTKTEYKYKWVPMILDLAFDTLKSEEQLSCPLYGACSKLVDSNQVDSSILDNHLCLQNPIYQLGKTDCPFALYLEKKVLH